MKEKRDRRARFAGLLIGCLWLLLLAYLCANGPLPI